jgi:hypothetical protein
VKLWRVLVWGDGSKTASKAKAPPLFLVLLHEAA